MTEVLGSDIVNSSHRSDKVCKVKTYDFKRPDKFSKEQIRTMAIMHETFARLTTTTLSSRLRSLSHVHVAAVDQLTYEEFIRSVPNPSALAIINMDPLRGLAVLEIDPSITFAIVDRLFGGQGSSAVMDRELSEIEQTLIKRMIEPFLGNLRESWSLIVDLQPRFGQIETNPQFAQIVPPTEMVVLVTLETKIGEVEGMMNFCMPFVTIEPIVPKLSAMYYYRMVRQSRRESAQSFQNTLKASAEVYLSCESLSLKEIGELKKGSLVRIPDLENGVAGLKVGGEPLMSLSTVPPKCKDFLIPKEGHQVEDQVKLAVKQTRQQDSDHLSEIVRTSMQGFSSELKGSFQRLDRSIADLMHRQEEVVDNLYLSGQVDVPTERRFEDEGVARPFHFVGQDDLVTLFTLLGNEHPQTLALITSYLDPRMAADFLSMFDDGMQIELSRRISMLDRTAPEVLKELTDFVQSVLTTSQKTSHFRAGGIEATVEILNVIPRSVEKTVIEGLEVTDADLAEELKKRMFVFEDIVLLDVKAVTKVVGRSSDEDITKALKGVLAEVQEKVLGAMEKERAETIVQSMEETGPVRLRDVEAAQQRIVNLIRQFEEEGEIVVARSDEQIV